MTATERTAAKEKCLLNRRRSFAQRDSGKIEQDTRTVLVEMRCADYSCLELEAIGLRGYPSYDPTSAVRHFVYWTNPVVVYCPGIVLFIHFSPSSDILI